MKVFFPLILLSIIMVGCSKPQKDVLRDLGIVQGKTSFESYASKTCMLKLTYAINSNAFEGNLLPTHLFYFDSIASLESPSELTYAVCEVKETTKIYKPLFPASIFLLMDKSVTSITESFNLDHLLPFKEAFFNNLDKHSGKYEINFGICARDNSLIPSYKTLYKDFKNDNRKLEPDSFGKAFDLSLNGGISNVAQSIDTTLSYIKSHAHYSKRILFVYTDNLSGVADTSVLTPLLEKARNTNTHIVLYNTRSPDQVLYSHRRYVNGSDGFQFNSYALGVVWSASYRNMTTLFNIFDGVPMYETTMRLICDHDFFANNKYGLLKMRVRLFNDVDLFITPLYER